MMTRPLGKTGFSIAPLVFGGNVFGWTIDEKTSFALLDAFVDHGFDAIDTADVYSRWAEGNQGGESETIIGRWLQARPGMRDKVKIFTKVGSDLGLPGHKGLSKAWIQQAVDDSLRRLNTDYIDLYFSHWPDPQTPVAETLEAFHSLQQAGKIRAMGASNLDAMQLAGALEVARKGGLPAWQVLQPEYNLYHRSAFEGALCDLCVSRDIGVVTYYSLASGFLTGKYRQPSDLTQSQRGSGIGKYLNPRGMRIIDTLAAVADEQGAKPAEVALAWLIGREGVTAPIASATSVAQVESFARAAALSLFNMWRTATGVAVELVGVSAEELDAALAAGDFDLALTTLTARCDDPMEYLLPFRGTSESNVCGYRNDTFDLLVGVAESTGDLTARAAFLHDAEAMLLEDSAVSPLCFSGTAYLLREGLAGVSHDCFGHSYFTAVSRAETGPAA